MKTFERIVSAVLIIAAGIAIGAAFPAHAGDKPVPPPFQPAEQVQKQAQSQQQTQVAQGGDAEAGAIADADADASARSDSDASADNAMNLSQSYRNPRQVPTVVAPPVYASGSCAYGVSGGLGLERIGVSYARTEPDPACDRREMARVLTPLNPWLALRLLCADPMVAEIITSQEDCRYDPPRSDSASTSVNITVPPGVTTEHLNRAFEASHSK